MQYCFSSFFNTRRVTPRLRKKKQLTIRSGADIMNKLNLC